MTADALVPGMSGAPVICDGDGAVAGVVSGRYNTADGWLAHTVWVARTEDLAVLLDGVAGVAMRRVPLAAPVDLLLTIDTERVRLSAGPADISAPHGGVRPGLAEAVNEARRARARIGQVLAAPLPAGELAGDLSLARAGRLLGESFLPGPVAAELTRLLAEAERAYQPVRLGVAAAPELAWLPWEALPRPGWPRAAGPAPAGPRLPPGQRRGAAPGSRGRCGSWSRSPPRWTAAAAWSTTSGTCAA